MAPPAVKAEVDQLQVRFRADNQNRPLGTLTQQDDGQVGFEFYSSFLADPLPLSPFQLPVAPGLHVPSADFGPLFGLFADSLPDETDPRPPLVRLAGLGRDARGALSYDPAARCGVRTPCASANPIQQAYSLMASAAGLVLCANGDRIDRSGDVCHHVHRFGSLIHMREGGDYKRFLDTTRELTGEQEDVESALRLMIFNILAHNRKDHPQSIAFRMNADGTWRLAPVTDLSFSENDRHCMSIAGQVTDISEAHIQQVAQGAGIPAARASSIIDEVAYAVADWRKFASEVGLPAETTERIAAAFPQLPW
jgi:hypothetical protein